MRKVLLLVVALTMTAGCFVGPALSDRVELVDMTADDLVGVWQGDQRGGVIEFTADGDFYADDVGYMFVGFTDVLPAGFDIKHDKVPGSGQWSIGTLLGHSQGPSGLIVKRPEIGGGCDHCAGATVASVWCSM